jgi:hypothetical protein
LGALDPTGWTDDFCPIAPGKGCTAPRRLLRRTQFVSLLLKLRFKPFRFVLQSVNLVLKARRYRVSRRQNSVINSHGAALSLLMSTADACELS